MMTAVEKIRKSLQEVGIEIAYRWHLIWLARRTGKSIEWWDERKSYSRIKQYPRTC